MNITTILSEVKIISDLQHIISKYLSKSHNKLLNNNNNIIIEEIIKYDPTIIICFGQKNVYLNYLIIDDIISLCAKYGLFNHLKWFKKNDYLFSAKIFENAALNGDIKIMKWLYKNKCTYGRHTFSSAAKNGNLENMKWLLDIKCTHDDWVFPFAAKNGKLTNLKWLLENNFRNDSYVMSYAAQNGNLENIKWLVQNDFQYNDWTFFKALENGNMENIEWLVKNLLDEKDNIKFTDKSQTIKYLIESKTLERNNEYFAMNSISKGNLEMMELLFENEFKFPFNDSISIAAQGKNLEAMKWLLKKNFPLTEDAFIASILKNNFDIIKWLYENKCPTSKKLLNEAIYRGNTDVINWMLENKFPICESDINNMKIDNIEVIKCLRKYNLYFPIRDNINIDLILKHLQLNDFKGIYEDAIERKDHENIEILLRNNIPYDINSFRIAVKNNIIRFDKFEFLSTYDKKKIFKILLGIIKMG